MTCEKHTHKPDLDFTSDGCSGGMSWLWRTLLRRPPPWEGACITHDRAYWYGGSRQDRLKADRHLAACVALSGYPLIGTMMYYAVRLGGMPHWRFSWRWNYGSEVREYRGRVQ